MNDGGLKTLLKHSDLLGAVAVVVIVAMMLVPMPTPLIDLFITINICAALMILITTMYVPQALDFSVFPSLLLITTLFRLGINISVTRLVLLHADAGGVIHAFGSFVVGGNVLVGLVVFLIIVVIQFVVITNGAGRVAEVAARFTLDAMPGKQMAIDADLNAGQITDQEARRRREQISREADFYGAMDGAIRFTQRDAMAAILITAVNIVAGLVIGVLQRGMPLSEAAQTFTILTVGEGLVTAIPALLVSMSGGLITTRAASESPLGEEVASQLLTRARPLAVAAGALLLLAAIPGLPKTAFITVGALLGLAAWFNRNAALAAPAEDAAPAAPPSDTPDIAAVDPLGVEVGYALISLVDEKQGGTLLSRIRSIRKQIATDSGLVVPPVHVADNLQLGPRTYAILVKGVEVARGELMPDRMLAINPGTATTPVDGIATREPAFGLPAWWIPNEHRDRASTAGYTVVDPTTALSTHLSEMVRTFLPDLLSRQQTKELLDKVAQTSPRVVEDLVPKVLSTGDVQRVLRQLLRERVPIRDLTTILEALSDAAVASKDPDALIEAVRGQLGRAICRQYQSDRNELVTINLAPSLEERLMKSIVRTEQGAVLALEPLEAQNMATKIARALEQAVAQPVLLCTPALRPHLWRLFSRVLPQIGVLSHGEVPTHIRIAPVAVLD